jgi:hypothetical protein
MEEKTATIRSTAVESWLTGLEREGWTIHSYKTTGQAGGKVRVTAAVARPGRPAATTPPAAVEPVDQPVDGGLW